MKKKENPQTPYEKSNYYAALTGYEGEFYVRLHLEYALRESPESLTNLDIKGKLDDPQEQEEYVAEMQDDEKLIMLYHYGALSLAEQHDEQYRILITSLALHLRDVAMKAFAHRMELRGTPLANLKIRKGGNVYLSSN